MLTKETIKGMKEDSLRAEVLIPLLKAMGYYDVVEYHGGAGEQGKDIVAWKLDDVGARKNIAIVAKATQMSGKASVSKATAGEVQTQIRQCFGHEYLDPVTSEMQLVHTVWVVSNKKISKEAITAIKAAIADINIVRNVEFISGDKLWELVQQYLPVSIWPYVEEIQNYTKTSDTHYEPQITITSNNTSIILKEKFTGASIEKPIIIKPIFIFPDKEMREKYLALIETGQEVEIPSEFIDRIEIPDFLQSLLGIKNFKPFSFYLSPIRELKLIPVIIHFLCEDGDSFSFNYILLKIEQIDEKKVVLSGKENNIFVDITLVLNFDVNNGSFSIKRKSDQLLNAFQHYNLLKIYSCLSKNIQIEVINFDTNISICKMYNQQKNIGAYPTKYLEFFRKLSFIQQQTKKTLIIPKREITGEELQKIFKIYEVITKGQIEENWNSCEIMDKPVKPRTIMV